MNLYTFLISESPGDHNYWRTSRKEDRAFLGCRAEFHIGKSGSCFFLHWWSLISHRTVFVLVCTVVIISLTATDCRMWNALSNENITSNWAVFASVFCNLVLSVNIQFDAANLVLSLCCLLDVLAVIHDIYGTSELIHVIIVTVIITIAYGSLLWQVMRLEKQVKRFQSAAESLEKSEEELKAEKRKFQKDVSWAHAGI